MGILQGQVEVGSRHFLLSGAVLYEGEDGMDGILRVIKAFGPEGAADRHGIVGSKLFLYKCIIPQALSHQAQQLVADPVDALFVKNTDPRADRPLDGRIADQVVVLDHGKKMQESLRPSGVHGLADCLSGPFLKSGRQQEFTQGFVEFIALAFHNAKDHFPAEHEGIAFPEKDIPDGLQRPGIMPVDLGGQNVRAGEILVAGVVVKLRRKIAGHDIRKFRIVEVQTRKSAKKLYTLLYKGSVTFGAQAAAKPPGSHLVAVHLIQRIVEIFLPCLPHTDIHQIWKLLPVQFAQCLILAAVKKLPHKSTNVLGDYVVG